MTNHDPARDGYSPRADPDAERLVIAAALTGQPIEPLARIVAPGDFREPRHEAIWQAMLDVTHAGGTIDIASVRAARADEQRRGPTELHERLLAERDALA